MLRGNWISSADLVLNGEASLRALGSFCERRDQLGAQATAFVSYFREAFVTRGAEQVRVTFDRKIAGHPYDAAAGLVIPDETAVVAVNGVVLELKYDGRAPRWMHDLITSFGLQRQSFPKYVYAVDALGIASHMAGSLPGRSVRC